MKIGFIGAGNMGGAILRGYLNGGSRFDHEVLVFGVNQSKLEKLHLELGITPCNQIEDLVSESDIIILGVKPNIYEEVLPKIKETFTNEKVLVSMAAGVKISFIEKFLGKDAMIVRIMPNTPAMVCEGMTSISKNHNVTEELFPRILDIFKGVGKVELVEEDLIHGVIGVSGSSPAYTYMYIEGLIKSAIEDGMKPEQARTFAAQAVLGAAKMVLESEESLEQLRINVCSPKGTTLEAVETLQKNGFIDKVIEGSKAAVRRSKEMEK